MFKMTQEQWTEFVSAGTRTAKLATTRLDGSPHVVPVWFVVEDDTIVFMTGEATIKGKSLLRTGIASICVDEEVPPFAFVTISGPVTISRDLDEMLAYSTQIGGRYMGADRAQEFGRRNAVPEELLVRLKAEHVVAVGGLTD